MDPQNTEKYEASVEDLGQIKKQKQLTIPKKR